MSASFNRDGHGGPCYLCEDRNPGCHAKCERYIAWSNELKRVKELRQEDRKRYDTMSDSSVRKMWREKRYGRNQKRRHSGHE